MIAAVAQDDAMEVQHTAADVSAVLQQLFARCDKDRSGSLDASELAMLVRDVARTFAMRMLDGQVQEEVRKILAQLGKDLAGTVTPGEFVSYVQANPESFGPLMVWQTLFAKYKGAGGEVDEAGLLQLVTDISVSLGMPVNKALAKQRAAEVLQAADTNGDGTVGFEEFVVFAKTRPDLFGELASIVGEAVYSPRKGVCLFCVVCVCCLCVCFPELATLGLGVFQQLPKSR
jgi:Ca2+-binding EF-hand superfamily protein